MGTTAVLLITVVLFLWGVLSGRLERADLTAPIIFVAVGGLFAASGLVDAPSVAQTLKPLVEVTLVWVLFSDAAGVAFGQMRHDLGRIVRLLGIGLPLTVVAGWALAQWLFPSQGICEGGGHRCRSRRWPNWGSGWSWGSPPGMGRG